VQVIAKSRQPWVDSQAAGFSTKSGSEGAGSFMAKGRARAASRAEETQPPPAQRSREAIEQPVILSLAEAGKAAVSTSEATEPSLKREPKGKLPRRPSPGCEEHTGSKNSLRRAATVGAGCVRTM